MLSVLYISLQKPVLFLQFSNENKNGGGGGVASGGVGLGGGSWEHGRRQRCISLNITKFITALQNCMQ